MRNISFMLTIPAMEDRTKDVTRRVAWWNLKAGDELMAVHKSQGLKRGDKVQKLYPIRVVSVRKERLSLLTENIDYGYADTLREGFPNLHRLNSWTSSAKPTSADPTPS